MKFFFWVYWESYVSWFWFLLYRVELFYVNIYIFDIEGFYMSGLIFLMNCGKNGVLL